MRLPLAKEGEKGWFMNKQIANAVVQKCISCFEPLDCGIDVGPASSAEEQNTFMMPP
jgi:hypothetical protein